MLITGGAGFIGSHLTERLLMAGHRVRVIDNFTTGKRENIPASERLEVLTGDVRDPLCVTEAAVGADAVVHLAAVASVQACVDDPLGTHQTNLVGTLHVLEAARQQRVRRLLFASSAAVYGDTATVPVAEGVPLSPLTPYAADKLASEHYLRFYQNKFGVAATAFRFFNIYGPRQDPSSPYSGVISIFVERLRRRLPVTLFGDGEQTRDFVYVTDLATMLTKALTMPSLEGQVVNVGRGVECSLLELLATLEQLTGVSLQREHMPPRLGDIRRSCADIGRLTALTGGAPPTTLTEGLRHLLEYMGN